jgi:hypothetical protein
MGNVVNLRLARKRKAREQAEAQAAANRRKFGRTPAQRAAEAAEAEEARRKLDRLKLDDPPPRD